MSEELNKELTKLISKAAIDGTLSESAVKQFTDVLKDNVSLKAMLETSEKHREKGEQTLRLVQQERDDARKVRDVLLAKEKDMNERIAQDEVLQVTVKYEQKRVNDHKEMVGLIFRNSLLRSQVMTPGHPGHVDQYGTVQNQGFDSKHDLEATEE